MAQGISSDDVRKIVNDEIKHLPSKNDFYGKMDEVMGELKAIREEITIVGGRQSVNSDQLEDHEERIAKFEKGCPTTPSSPL